MTTPIKNERPDAQDVHHPVTSAAPTVCRRVHPQKPSTATCAWSADDRTTLALLSAALGAPASPSGRRNRSSSGSPRTPSATPRSTRSAAAPCSDGDAALIALLTARPDADPAAVVAAVLGPLTDPAHGHLLDGLAAFLSTGSATGAAELLHPQTLRYRLRRVRELTGRDPRDPWQRLALDVAQTLASIRVM